MKMPREFERLFKTNGLTMDRLRTLCDLETFGSYSAMAPGDRTSHSKFSHQISQLEDFFGGDICLVKKGEITDAGRKLAGLAREHFRKLEGFLEAAGEEKIHFIITASGSVIEWLLIPRLAPVMKKHPEISFDFHDETTEGARKALLDGRADYAVLRETGVGKQLHTVRIAEYGYKFYGPKDVKPKDLPRMPLVLAQGAEFREKLAEITPEPLVERYRLRRNSECAAAVRLGVAASILPETADSALKGFQSYQPDWLAGYRRSIMLAWRRRPPGEVTGKNIKAVEKALKG